MIQVHADVTRFFYNFQYIIRALHPAAACIMHMHFMPFFCKNGRRPYYHTITHCLLSLINEFVFVDDLLE